jgi:hypothetical protein
MYAQWLGTKWKPPIDPHTDMAKIRNQRHIMDPENLQESGIAMIINVISLMST